MSESKNLDLYMIGNNIHDLREQKQLTQIVNGDRYDIM